MNGYAKRFTRAAAVPYLLTLAYGAGFCVVMTTSPGFPRRAQYIAVVPFFALMARVVQVLLGVAEGMARERQFSLRPYWLLAWGNWLAWGGLSATMLLAGLGWRSAAVAGIAVAVAGISLMAAGFVGALPADLAAWRESRRGR